MNIELNFLTGSRQYLTRNGHKIQLTDVLNGVYQGYEIGNPKLNLTFSNNGKSLNGYDFDLVKAINWEAK